MAKKDKPLRLIGGGKFPRDHDAQMELARSFYEADNATAYADVLERAIADGNTEAMSAMAAYLLWESSDDGYVSELDVKKAVHYAKQAILGGSPFAHFVMGLLLIDGDFVAQNVPMGVRHLEMAHDKGHPDSAYELARIAELDGRMDDYIEYLLEGVARGVPNACYRAGLHHLDGDLLPHDPLQAHMLIGVAIESQGCSWLEILTDYLERKKNGT